MTARRIVVTGAAGYIGPHVVKALLDRGDEVIANVRPGSDVTIIDERATIHEADILAPDFDPSAWGAPPDAVVHLAWKDGFRHASRAHMEQVSAHYRFLIRVGEAGVPRLVVLGTMHEVGYWEGAIEADTPTNPASPYGIAKDALRRSISLALPEDTQLVWARCYYIEGDDRRSQSVFTRILEAVDAGRTEFPFVTGNALHDFIDVDELGRQLAALTDATDVTGVVNCCTGTPTSLADEVERFIDRHQLPIRLIYGAFPERPYDSPGIWGDPSIINQILERERP